MKNFVIIAMDGMAASGKSTTAIALARKLGYLNVNTGNHYRSMTALWIKDNKSLSDLSSIGNFLDSCRLDTKINGNSADMVINGMATNQLDMRSNLINSNVSIFAKNMLLREFLKKYQRGLVKIAIKNGFGGMVMEGRDIGSVVFPEADFKFFLTAEKSVRMNRRGINQHGDDICLRDNIDFSTTSPLKDVIEVNTTNINVNQVVEFMAKIILTNKTIIGTKV